MEGASSLEFRSIPELAGRLQVGHVALREAALDKMLMPLLVVTTKQLPQVKVPVAYADKLEECFVGRQHGDHSIHGRLIRCRHTNDELIQTLEKQFWHEVKGALQIHQSGTTYLTLHALRQLTAYGNPREAWRSYLISLPDISYPVITYNNFRRTVEWQAPLP